MNQENRKEALPRVMRLPEVIRMIGVSRSDIYVRIQSGDFPRRIKLGPRSIGFLEAEVEDYLRSMIARSRDTDAKEAGQ